jgi:Fe-S-cluster containining protein
MTEHIVLMICENCACYDKKESLCRAHPITLFKEPEEWCRKEWENGVIWQTNVSKQS